ncbi:MAG: L,D-transpeptidase family protein [Desulfuromonadaceae bacterium]|nr:L,D-transpeptidase family protein [Desulfuromonadaceae bacterium]
MTLAGFLLLFQATAVSPVCSAEIHEIIRSEVEQIRAGGYLIGNAWVASTSLLPRFYEARGFEPAWQDARRRDNFIKFLSEIGNEGLNPQDYHFTSLVALREEIRLNPHPEVRKLAHWDLLLTDSLMVLVNHLLVGKVDPLTLHPEWNFSRRNGYEDPLALIREGMETADIGPFLHRLLPTHPLYLRLKEALAEYRARAAEVNWGRVAEGETLRGGMSGKRVGQLAQRLAASGDFAGPLPEKPFFDHELTAAVKGFQRRHGLQADGVVGPRTLAELNVPDEERIDQLRVNMERMRWFLHDLPEDFLIVDIAGFRACLIQGGKMIWSAKVQVGRPFRETPSFRSQIDYLVVNPDWTLPPTIVAEDVVPAVLADSAYLEKNSISILDYQGRRIDPARVDWRRYRQAKFPYLLRQEPGPQNPLGRIKFIFPNPHAVFLHDTPSRYLFGKSERAFSSGCIRIERPFELAAFLLESPSAAGMRRLREALDSGKTKTIFLPRPMPIMLLYWTAQVGPDGEIIFKRDIYGRDSLLLQALDRKFALINGAWLSF